MSALHYGRAAAAPDATGRLVYTAASAERAIAGWPEVGIESVAGGKVAWAELVFGGAL